MTVRGVAVITGSARGIGAQIAADLHAAGLTVVVCDRNEQGARDTAAALGEGAFALPLDITAPQAPAAFVSQVEREIGPITLWVNNAGIMPTGPFATQSASEADTIIDVNLRGMLACTRAVLPVMTNRGIGVIVNVASATGVKPLAGLAVYSATKAAVIAVTKALRRELRGSGVHIGAVLPYLAATPMGAGIQAQRGFTPVTPTQVSAQVMRVIRRREVVRFVPPSLRWSAALMDVLPLRVQDAIDDAIGTDRIGLGGDATAREAYRHEALD